jgi:flagellar protein FliO/FliZ
MELLFGGMQDVARFVVAFMLVLGLIGAGALFWRRFGAGPLSLIGPRSRQPRIAVIDAASVDARRQLVLIRRDNAEHLIMIGGPTDIVIEPNITRTGTIPVSREPRPIPAGDSSRQPTSTESPGWALPLEQTARPLRTVEDLDAPSEPPHRSAREAMAESKRAVRPEPAARRSPAAELRAPPEDEITAPALTPSLPAATNYRATAAPEARRASTPPQPPLYEPAFQAPPQPQRPPTMSEPISHFSDAEEVKRAATPPPRQLHSDENNLAEMAQRLEAALRRPTKPVEPPTVPPAAARPVARPEPSAAPPAAARSAKPIDTSAAPPAAPRTTKPAEPSAAPPAAARPAARPEPSAARRAAQFEAVNPPKGSVKSPEPPSSPPSDLKILSGKAKVEPQPPFESLEDEMAKMLGRSPGKS